MKKQISPEHLKRLSELGCYLRELRFCEGRTQAEVSKDLNLHQNTIARMENGCNMTLGSLIEIADLYECPLKEIMNDLI